MRQVQASRLLPIQAKLVLVAPRRDVRMAAGLHIRIHANRNRRHRSAAPPFPRRLFQQRRKLRFTLNIEEQDAARTAAPSGTIPQRLAHLLARLAHPRKHDALAGHANALQKLQLAARNNVEAAAQARQILQNRKVAVRFHRETKRVRQSAKPGHQLVVSVANRRLAVDIRWRARLLRYVPQRNALATNRFACPGISARFFPRKVWSERCRIDVRMLLALLRGRIAHRTFSTTKVRSSASGALSANKSTSRRTRSASSVAVTSCLSSISLRNRCVPKNCPSLLVVSAIPSEWNTRMSPGTSVTPHSS